MSTRKFAQLDSMFAQKDYLRKRIAPQPGEPGYLHRSDLLLALQRQATAEKLTVLDYGAGVSPYRSLFPNSDYRRADITDVGIPDYLINENGIVPEKSDVFDVVLSTQVVHHVYDPSTYLSECFRLLKPGGALLLTTHGLYEDNECPGDFQRWTADGLRRDLQKIGFDTITVYKLSTGPRAILYFIERYLYTMPVSRKTLPGLLHWVCWSVFRRSRRWIHVQTDRYYSAYRVVPSDIPNHNIYTALLACAHRPL